MDHRHLEDIDFKTPFDKVERLIETKYDLRVIISDVLDPNTGDFDGLEIKIDYAQTIEVGLFILAHLFGHTVQWNVSEEYRKLGENHLIYQNLRRRSGFHDILFKCRKRIWERDLGKRYHFPDSLSPIPFPDLFPKYLS